MNQDFMTLIPLFSTQRIEFLPPSEGDLEFRRSLFQDAELMQYLGGPLTLEAIEEGEKRRIETWKQLGFASGISRLKKTSVPVGSLSLFWKEVEGENVLEIGWITATRFQGKGLTFEAANGYVEWAKNHLKFNAIAAFPNAQNFASNRILEKLGFRKLKPFKYSYGESVLDSVYWRLDPPM